MYKSLFIRSGSRYRLAKGVEILEAAAHVQARTYEAARPQLLSPADAQAFLIGQLRHCVEEYFCVLYLDNQMRVISFEKAFRGTIDGSSVHPREIVREVLDRNAASVIIAHNHPSGYPYPSDPDRMITLRMQNVFAMIDVRLLDHVIVGDVDCYSFAESGELGRV